MSILFEFDPAHFKAESGAVVPSPCVNVCRMDEANGWCSGCYRSIDEIICWSKVGNQEKLHIWHKIHQRLLP
ncbi:MAG: DUF1289 domain-containing protein [Burkholderiales bacterium]|nr:DUF1289 domain-containing protein [Burkholderiales bacterium]